MRNLIPVPPFLTLSACLLVATNLRVSKGVHDYLTEKGVPHVWRVDTNGHDTGVMSNSLYHVAQKLFKE